MAGSRGLADVYHNVVKEHITSWVEQGARPKIGIWREVEDIVLRAVSLSPMDSDLLLTAGYFYEWKPTTDRDERLQVLKLAIGYYKLSIGYRPAWPIGWRDLASAKFKMGETDSQFLAAFGNALELGPWEEGILFGMSDLGYAAWWKLPAAERKLAMENHRKALSRDPKRLFKLAMRNKRVYLYCYIAKGDEKAMRFCNKKDDYAQ